MRKKISEKILLKVVSVQSFLYFPIMLPLLEFSFWSGKNKVQFPYSAEFISFFSLVFLLSQVCLQIVCKKTIMRERIKVFIFLGFCSIIIYFGNFLLTQDIRSFKTLSFVLLITIPLMLNVFCFEKNHVFEGLTLFLYVNTALALLMFIANDFECLGIGFDAYKSLNGSLSNDFIGLYSEKNGNGKILAISSLVFLCIVSSKVQFRTRIVVFSVAVCAIYLLLQTNSRGANLLFLGGAFAFFLSLFLSNYDFLKVVVKKNVTLAIIFLAVFSVLFVVVMLEILRSLGELTFNENLSWNEFTNGRYDVWVQKITELLDLNFRPLGFAMTYHNEPWVHIGNAFIGISLEISLALGVVVLLVPLFWAVKTCLSFDFLKDNIVILCASCLVAGIFMQQLFEFEILRVASINVIWFFAVAVLFKNSFIHKTKKEKM